MAEAHIVTSDGTKVQIKGTADEVAVLLTRFSSTPTVHPASGGGHKPHSKSKKDGKSQKQRKGGPTTYISTMATEGYFKAKRSISDVQKKLEEMGHIYAQTSLSPALTRLTRKRVLRRMKEKDGWLYVA
jgi:hypothetical protein